MKKPNIVSGVLASFIVSFCLFSSLPTAQAAEKAGKRGTFRESVSYSRSSADRSGMRVGGGFTTLYTASPALSAWIDFNSVHSLQVFLGIAGTSPFQMGFGTLYRATLAGGQQTGFHVGGGFNLGARSTGFGNAFFINITPAAGFHFPFPGSTNIGFSLDGGLNFMIFNSAFDFGLAALSPSLGLSAHYFF